MQKQFFQPKIIKKQVFRRIITKNYPTQHSFAKLFKQNPLENTRKDFYFASGKFAFETALIVGTVFYAASYQTVGIAYRSIGLNSFAFKCPSCVSVILSQAHWTIRTVLVEGSSQLAQRIIEEVEIMQQNETFQKIKESGQEVIEQGKKGFDKLIDDVKTIVNE